MKYAIYAALMLLVLAGAALAGTTCPYNEGHPTLLTTKCEVLKPVNALTDEEITVTCIKQQKENNAWVDYPLKGTLVVITGYTEEGVPLQNMTRSLNSAGSTVFTPQIAGRYVIETLVPQQNSDSAQAMLVPWVATFSVGENPIKNRGTVRSTPTGAAVAEEPVEPTEITAEEPPAAPAVCAPRGLFDFVINGTRTEQDKQDASSLVLAIVGLMLS